MSFDHDFSIRILGLIVVVAPSMMTAVLGTAALLGRPLSERTIGRITQSSILTGLAAAVGILFVMIAYGTRAEPISLGNWVAIPHYEFSVKFIFDRLSVPLAILSFILCGTVGAFANRYMHRESGFSRFFTLYALFVLGMVTTSLAGTIETMFVGWELVGLSSALLVAFFHERPAPCRNGLRVWTVYRISDAALLTASIVLHHMRGHGDFSRFMGRAPWPDGHAVLSAEQALSVGLLLIIAAAGKSALVPFSGWLPRAMEGPTPSSAVFYGALSVHLGAFLLLRFSPLMELSPWLGAGVIVLGAATSAFAALAGRVQTDIKSSLSYASLSQVGLIIVEIGVGCYWPVFRYVAIAHILGHGCLRTLQFIRAPTLLHDYRILENALGDYVSHPSRNTPGRTRPENGTRLYRLAFEHGFLDAILNHYVIKPFLALLHRCDRAERRWTDWLAGEPQIAPETRKERMRTVTLTDEVP